MCLVSLSERLSADLAECPGNNHYDLRTLFSSPFISLFLDPPPPRPSPLPCIDLLLVVCYSTISTDIYVCSWRSPVPIIVLSDRYGQCFNTSLLKKNGILNRHALSQHSLPCPPPPLQELVTRNDERTASVHSQGVSIQFEPWKYCKWFNYVYNS